MIPDLRLEYPPDPPDPPDDGLTDAQRRQVERGRKHLARATRRQVHATRRRFFIGWGIFVVGDIAFFYVLHLLFPTVIT